MYIKELIRNENSCLYLIILKKETYYITINDGLLSPITIYRDTKKAYKKATTKPLR